jgi:hypothetical protein
MTALPQMVPAAGQVLPAQQGSPTAPHAVHERPVPTTPAQMAAVELHVTLLQQGCPIPPQTPQLVPPSTRTHEDPAAVHSPLLTLTTLPRPQHACPIPPQASQVGPAASPTALGPVHVLLVQLRPGQQASPAAPQLTHCAVG